MSGCVIRQQLNRMVQGLMLCGENKGGAAGKNAEKTNNSYRVHGYTGKS